MQFLAGIEGKGLFIPFAAVTFSFDEYERIVKQAFSEMGFELSSFHQLKDKQRAIEEASFIAVGGGNSFALLSRMYEFNLLELVRKKVEDGTPYLGWSAGANLSCPTIKTTNDMPIVQPVSLDALNLVPFQINPHYHELKFEGQGGETRKDRLNEFLVLNPDKCVIGLPEGMLLERQDDKLTLKGNGEAKIYQANKVMQTIKAEADVSFLLAKG
ncbi:dipeptidase PepE [Chryseotalea sanaruensis]|uniref:Dipeptidase PepE n=2 Tax=Chryseotalea sanaruensis TaxID=2482724 RepID=A0A401UEE1_9BACT|nr:dipeptidase PepE [Chryseotalea sanaruensis]